MLYLYGEQETRRSKMLDDIRQPNPPDEVFFDKPEGIDALLDEIATYCRDGRNRENFANNIFADIVQEHQLSKNDLHRLSLLLEVSEDEAEEEWYGKWEDLRTQNNFEVMIMYAQYLRDLRHWYNALWDTWGETLNEEKENHHERYGH